MSEYIVNIGFWLRAYDGFTIEADSDGDAIDKAKAAAKAAMESAAHPEHVEIGERREGIIAFRRPHHNGWPRCDRGCRIRRRPHSRRPT
jgi:hypothetical protein